MAGCHFGVRQLVVTIALTCGLGAHAADRLQVQGVPGRPGGRLVTALRLEPRTLNWLVASDGGSREVISLLMADLIHINRQTQQTEAALAKSWKVSPDGLRWTIDLRRGLQFSDGHPFDADDVLFTFQAIYDVRSRSPQRDLLMLNGKPIAVRKLDPGRVEFVLPEKRAVADRLFDGVYILPRHLLESTWNEGKLADAWALSTTPGSIAGMGPYRLTNYSAGQQIVLERNPHYWKQDSAGQALPYLSEVRLLTVGAEDNQVLRFRNGETDMIARVGARNFTVLEKDQTERGYQMTDSGPSLETAFLVFNLGDAATDREIAARQAFMRNKGFRQAVSAAIDREAMVKLVYGGRANAIVGPVSPGNRAWVNARIPAPVRSLERARQLLAREGFHFNKGKLVDSEGTTVEFSILVSNSNPERQQMAAMIQDDLKPLGIQAHITPVDFRSLGDSVQRTRRFETALLAFATPDADPNPDLAVYLSSGGNHLWNPGQKTPATPWEAEMDGLMRRQQVTLIQGERKKLFDRVQEIMVENQAMVTLVSPHVLSGAKTKLQNFRPAQLEPYTTWNLDLLYWR